MKKLAITFALILALALVLGTLGCGENEAEPTPTPVPTPTDQELISELVDEQIAALNDVDLETVYNQRTPSYRSTVTLQEFETFLLMAYAEFLPLVESGQAEVGIADLGIRVEGEYAYMTAKLGLNGSPILEYTDEFPDIWQKIDGTWYNIETNPLFIGYDPSELP